MENIRSRSPFLSFRSLESSYFNSRVGGQFTFDSCPRLSLTLLETRGIRLTCNIFDIVKIELFQIPVYFFFFLFSLIYRPIFIVLLSFFLSCDGKIIYQVSLIASKSLSLCREYLPRRYCVWLIRYLVIRNPFLRMVETVIHWPFAKRWWTIYVYKRCHRSLSVRLFTEVINRFRWSKCGPRCLRFKKRFISGVT